MTEISAVKDSLVPVEASKDIPQEPRGAASGSGQFRIILEKAEALSITPRAILDQGYLRIRGPSFCYQSISFVLCDNCGKFANICSMFDTQVFFESQIQS